MQYLYKHLTVSCMAVILLCGLIFVGVADTSPAFARVAYEAVDQHLYPGGQPSLMTDAGKKRIAVAIAAMKKSGIYDVIAQKYGEGSDEAALMMAIIVRESTGALNAINQGSKAACAHQVMPYNLAGWYKQGLTRYTSLADFQTAVMTDPAVCHEWGRKAYDDQVGAAIRKGFSGQDVTDRALCGYAGELRMYREQGFCWASDEYKLTAARILGRDFSYVVSDKESGKFAQKVTIDKKTGRVLATEFLCKDHSQEFPLAIAKMADAYKVTISETQHQVFVNQLRNYDERRITLHIPPEEKPCLNNYKAMFKRIKDAQSESTFDDWLKDVYDGFMEQACQYVATQADIALSNLLTAACVPLPDLRFSIGVDLPSLERTSCDGLSLFSAQLQTSGYTAQEIADGVADMFPEGTIPAYDSTPTDFGPSMVPYPTLKIRLDRGGVYEFF